MTYTLEQLNKKYDLELDKIISKIKAGKCKLVLLQFPDGLKQYAISVVDYLEKETSAEFLIYFGSCFGACDTPNLPKEIKVDLVVQFGHNEMMPSY